MKYFLLGTLTGILVFFAINKIMFTESYGDCISKVGIGTDSQAFCTAIASAKIDIKLGIAPEIE